MQAVAVAFFVRIAISGASACRALAPAFLFLCFGGVAVPGLVAQGQDAPASQGIAAVPGIRAGHFTYPEALTGCTVVIAEGGAVGAVDVRGGAPGTAETDLLDPANVVQRVNAVVLSGGSAFGLAARDGVMQYLEEQGEGFRVSPDLVVPIVPGAVIFDLWMADRRPGPECGYRAAAAAVGGSQGLAEGSVGAGAGATVGKLRGRAWAMMGGVGTASAMLANGLVVSAVVVVNALGDVIDPNTGAIVAGARTEEGGLADARRLLRGEGVGASPGQNTTLGVVATNAQLTQAQATKVAQMAHDGLARTIVPSHTPSDGDAIFALATGRWPEEGADTGVDTRADADVGQIGALAAEVVAEAVLRAVRAARGVPGIPAVRDLSGF